MMSMMGISATLHLNTKMVQESTEGNSTSIAMTFAID